MYIKTLNPFSHYSNMESLTARQAEMLELIRETHINTGMPLARMEIGLSSANAAEEHLRALTRKGDLLS